jgi:hypothetical protein
MRWKTLRGRRTGGQRGLSTPYWRVTHRRDDALTSMEADMRRSFTVVALLALIAPVAASAQSPVTWSVELPFRSKYLFAGIPFAAEQVQQAQVSAAVGSFTINGFGVYDVDASDVTEADVYADYYSQLSPGVGAYVGGALYSFKLATGWESTPELYAGLVFTAPLNPILAVAHDFDLGDGTRVTASLSHPVPLGEGGAVLTLGADADYNSEYYTADSGISYVDAHASIGIPVGAVTISPMVLIQRRVDDDFADDFIVDEEVFGITASFTFGGG